MKGWEYAVQALQSCNVWAVLVEGSHMLWLPV